MPAELGVEERHAPLHEVDRLRSELGQVVVAPFSAWFVGKDRHQPFTLCTHHVVKASEQHCVGNLCHMQQGGPPGLGTGGVLQAALQEQALAVVQPGLIGKGQVDAPRQQSHPGRVVEVHKVVVARHDVAVGVADEDLNGHLVEDLVPEHEGIQ